MPRFFWCLCFMLLSGCAGLHPEPPKVSLQSLKVSHIDLSRIDFLVELELFNPNSFGMTIEGISYRLVLNDEEFVSGSSPVKLELQAGKATLVPLQIQAAFADLARLARTFKAGNELTYRLTGDVTVGGFGFLAATIPFDRDGVVKLRL